MPNSKKAHKKENEGPAWALVMAGGGGTRLWPFSRTDLPKQLQSPMGGKPLLTRCVENLSALIPPERVLVVCASDLADKVQQRLPDLPQENILAEPESRNTAPCVALGLAALASQPADAVLVVLPSDHYIQDVEAYVRALTVATGLARERKTLVLLGVRPTAPDVGFGYIACAREWQEVAPMVAVRRGHAFCEKPDLNTARHYLAQGSYFWNTGIYVATVPAFFDLYQQHARDIFRHLQAMAAAWDTGQRTAQIEQAFAAMPKISLDRAVAERCTDFLVVESNFGWSDLGNWARLADFFTPDEHGNVVLGEGIAIDSSGCLVASQSGLVAVIGMEDVVVAKSEDATLVCPKSRVQDVARVAKMLQEDKARRRFA